MADLGDQVAVGTCDHTTILHEEVEWIEPGWFDHRFVSPAYFIREDIDVHRLVFRFIGNADPTADINELYTDIQGCFYLDGELEKHLGRIDEVVGVQLVGGDHGMHTETLDSLVPNDFVAFENLGLGEAVFRLFRFADDGVALSQGTGVVAEAKKLGDAHIFFQIGDMADIIEIDDGTQLFRLLILHVGGIVGAEHDLFPAKSDFFGQDKFGKGAAVRAEALLLEDLENIGIRCGFHGKEFPESRRPGKGGVQFSCVFTDCLFIVDMKRGRVFFDDCLDLLFCKGKVLCRHALRSLQWLWNE